MLCVSQPTLSYIGFEMGGARSSSRIKIQQPIKGFYFQRGFQGVVRCNNRLDINLGICLALDSTPTLFSTHFEWIDVDIENAVPIVTNQNGKTEIVHFPVKKKSN